MSVRHALRQQLQRLGVDLSRYPQERAEHRRALLLREQAISATLDVGANTGQFGEGLRRFGYRGRIISFEPLPNVWEALRAKAAPDPLWDTVQCALGRVAGTVELNIAGNNGASSSVLPMLDRHRSAAPQAAYVDAVFVEQRTLDDVALPMLAPSDRVLLKIDVQGYEQEVLAGAPAAMHRARAVQLELSLVPLYENGLLYREAIDYMQTAGFQLQWLQPGFSDPVSGQLLQFDALFLRVAP